MNGTVKIAITLIYVFKAKLTEWQWDREDISFYFSQ